mmetsp:Transcript_19541/g.62226  ORF Transcript_19541/g.62226 Transcript_19541/m.62226 type:complete len:232 (+) Transcript_19541:122-817(+)
MYCRYLLSCDTTGGGPFASAATGTPHSLRLFAALRWPPQSGAGHARVGRLVVVTASGYGGIASSSLAHSASQAGSGREGDSGPLPSPPAPPAAREGTCAGRGAPCGGGRFRFWWSSSKGRDLPTTRRFCASVWYLQPRGRSQTPPLLPRRTPQMASRSSPSPSDGDAPSCVRPSTPLEGLAFGRPWPLSCARSSRSGSVEQSAWWAAKCSATTGRLHAAHCTRCSLCSSGR